MQNFEENNVNLPEQSPENPINETDVISPENAYSGDAAQAPDNPTAENQAADTPPAPVDFPVLNRVNYSPQKPITDYKPFGKGLKVFCIVLAAVVLLTAACTGGYFLGKNSNVFSSAYRNDVKLDLTAKPKNQDGMTAAEVYDLLSPSIVGVRVYNSSAAVDASGVVYTDEGYIITNDHIYDSIGAPKFKIYSYDGKEYDAEYVAGDSISDLAVLKIKGGNDLKPATFGDSAELVCGESVFAVGRPSDAADAASITAGTVSFTSRRVKSKTNYSASLIQTDSAINPGSSGGALSNMYGQVVGITSSKMEGSEYDRIGFAIPTVTVKRVVDQLISGGKVKDRAKLGITYNEINSVVKQMGGYAAVGLLVQTVSSDSSLYGKISKGDIITHVNGVQITKDDIMLDMIESLKAGDEIKITVLLSSGSQSDFVAKLGANVGESSYKSTESATEDSSEKDNSSKSDGTFDFPFGY